MTAGADSCFAPMRPVDERIHIRVSAEGEVAVRVAVRLMDFTENKSAHQRFEQERQMLEAGQDVWSRRFAAMSPSDERIILERADGQLCAMTHIGVLKESESLRFFFSDSLVTATAGSGEGWAEMTFVPGHGTRATRDQVERMDRELDTWAAGISGYLSAVRPLYAYLDQHPDRARVCFAEVFKDLELPADIESSRAGITKEEWPLCEAVNDTMGGLLSIFLIHDGEAASVEEISQLVYDPFPAPLTLEVAGTIQELEGFEKDARGRLAVPGLSLWKALQALEGRWVTPDPALVFFAQKSTDTHPPFDFDAVVQQKRHCSTPPAADIRKAIEQGLRPAALYRVRWIPPDKGNEDDQGVDWNALMSSD